MRYMILCYPTHWEVIDNAKNRLPVYETRRLELARIECDRLNREEARKRWNASADTTQRRRS